MSVEEVLLGTATLHVTFGDLTEPSVRNVPEGRHERLVLRTWTNDNHSKYTQQKISGGSMEGTPGTSHPGQNFFIFKQLVGENWSNSRLAPLGFKKSWIRHWKIDQKWGQVQVSIFSCEYRIFNFRVGDVNLLFGQFFPRKLHENEEILAYMEYASRGQPLEPIMILMEFFKICHKIAWSRWKFMHIQRSHGLFIVSCEV